MLKHHHRNDPRDGCCQLDPLGGGGMTIGGVTKFSYGTVVASTAVVIPTGFTVGEVTDDATTPMVIVATMPAVMSSPLPTTMPWMLRQVFRSGRPGSFS